ncbi:MAG: cyclase family protein [Christensenellales bacterium]|jgi:arylformamidase
MRWIDVTRPIQEGNPCWPGDVPFKHWPTDVIGVNGSPCNVSAITMSAHFGTHLDTPYHFFADGYRVQDIDLTLLMGPCAVVDLSRIPRGGRVEREDLEPLLPEGCKRLIIKTVGSALMREAGFQTDFVGVSPEAAQWVYDQGVRVLGMDYFSIAGFGADSAPVHRAFLGGRDAIAIEGVDLTDVAAGAYELLCLPMKLVDAGGAPCRVLLGEEETR